MLSRKPRRSSITLRDVQLTIEQDASMCASEEDVDRLAREAISEEGARALYRQAVLNAFHRQQRRGA